MSSQCTVQQLFSSISYILKYISHKKGTSLARRIYHKYSSATISVLAYCFKKPSSKIPPDIIYLSEIKFAYKIPIKKATQQKHCKKVDFYFCMTSHIYLPSFTLQLRIFHYMQGPSVYAFIFTAYDISEAIVLESSISPEKIFSFNSSIV